MSNGFLQGFANGMAPAQAIQEHTDRLREQRRVEALRNAQGNFYGGIDPQAGEIARLGGDPRSALQDRDGQTKQMLQRAGQVATILANAPDENSRRNVFRQARSALEPVSQHLGLPLPPDWDESYLDEVQSIAQMFAGGGTSANVQSSFVDASGNRVAIMRDGSIKVLGQNAPNNQIIEGAGGFYGVNKNTLNAAPVTMGGPQAPSGMTRLPSGQQVNIDPSMSDYERNLVMQYAPQLEQGGNFQGPPMMQGGQLQAPPPKPAAPSELEQRLSLADQFGATPDDKRQMVLGSSATRGTLSQKERRAIALQQAQIPALERRIDNIGRAFDKLSGNFFDGGPMDQLAIGMTQDGQMLESTAAQLKPLLLSFVRVPGIGAQSDLEARLDALQYPSIGNHPNVNRALLAELKQFIGDLKNAYTNVGSEAQAPAQASAPRRLKFNPQTGELE